MLRTGVFWILLSVLSDPFFKGFSIVEVVDVIELNHMFDVRGKPTFDQIIFWDFDPPTGRLHVRAWILSDQDKYPVMGANGLRSVSWKEGKYSRVVVGSLYRESWTTIDPEIANQRILNPSDRVCLTNGDLYNRND